MITRAQAEALITLAESLEACERLGVTVRPGTKVIWLKTPGEDCALEDGMTGKSVRNYLSERIA